MNVMSASIEPTLMSEGKESTIVMMRLRSSLAPLSSRRMRRMRSTRSTRSSIGGSGRICSSSSAANWSSSEVHTRKKSKRHLPRCSRDAGERQPRCRGGAHEGAADAAPVVGEVVGGAHAGELEDGLAVVDVPEAEHRAVVEREDGLVLLDAPVVAPAEIQPRHR